MKRLVMCGVVALALAGCTQSEVLNISSDRAIGFDAYTGKGTRVVSDITGGGSSSGFNKFIVYGSYANSEGQKNVVFNGVEVSYTTSGTESSWTYANEQYWQNGDYKFVTYSDGNGALSGGPTASYTHDGGLQIQNYVVGEKDLIFATQTASVTDKTTYNTAVELKFSHLLSKVKFTFTETFADNLTVEVSNLKIVNSKTKGTYKYDTDAYKWEIGTDTKEITYKTPVVVSTSYTKEECYVLPQSTNGLTASFTVTVKDALNTIVMSKNFTGDAAVSLNVTNATEWQNGFAYNYTAELTPAVIDPNAKPIQFTATADTWTENNSGSGTPIIPQP